MDKIELLRKKWTLSLTNTRYDKFLNGSDTILRSEL